MVEILVPIFCGCILPIAVVLIVQFRKRNSDNKRAEVLIKAIESGREVDADKMAEALGKPILTLQEQINLRLLRGCRYTLVGIALLILSTIAPTYDKDLLMMMLLIGSIALAIGIAYLIVYFVTRNQISVKKES